MTPNVAILLNLAINSLTQLIAFKAVLDKAVAEGRDLTDEEVAGFRAAAVAANQALADQA